MKNNESPLFSHSSNKGLAIETFPAKIPETAQPEKKPRNIPRHRFGSVDVACIVVCIGCLLTNEFTCISALHYTLIGVCVLSLFVPAAIQFIRGRNQFGINAIYNQFQRQGLNPMIKGNTIHWIFQGKMHFLRLNNGCQLQVFREYPLEPEIGLQFECAAVATMNEVFSAKVGVHHEDEKTGNIYFSTEMLCSSMKEFGRILPETVGILDAAEERQKENLRELLEEEKRVNEKSRRKIGFVQN